MLSIFNKNFNKFFLFEKLKSDQTVKHVFDEKKDVPKMLDRNRLKNEEEICSGINWLNYNIKNLFNIS